MAKEVAMANLISTATVLFSSGIDSLACAIWAKREYDYVAGLYIDIGVPYTDHEIQACRKLSAQLHLPWELEHFPFLGFLSGSSGHVPFRNIFFLEMAALHPIHTENVVFGMLQGEYSEDKSPAFVKRMQKLFDSQTAKNLYNKGSRIQIQTPFASFTKTQVVKWMLDTGVSVDMLKTTIGCLQSKACGQCMSCLNRWIAFENNNLFDMDEYEYEHPAKWGLAKLSSKDYKEARSYISFWKKRKWLADVHKAYRSAKQRGVVTDTPLERIFQ